MANLPELLRMAQQRGQEASLSYDGALYPAEAFQVLQQSESAVLVDVRTRAELDWVGQVPGAVLVEWQDYPGGMRNSNFLELLRQAVPEEALLLFMCRSGARSHAAATAASSVGFGGCYNILHGFEGDRDELGRRNRLNGWRATGLPWKQT